MFCPGSNDSDNSGDDVTVTVPSNTQNIINFFRPSPPLKNYTKMELSPARNKLRGLETAEDMRDIKKRAGLAGFGSVGSVGSVWCQQHSN